MDLLREDKSKIFSNHRSPTTFVLSLLLVTSTVFTQSDLREISLNPAIAMDTTFTDREDDDCHDMLEHYNMNFAEALLMDCSIIYRAVHARGVDVSVAPTTEERVVSMDLPVLEVTGSSSRPMTVLW